MVNKEWMQKMEYDMGKINGKDAQSEGNRMVFVHGLNSSKLELFCSWQRE